MNFFIILFSVMSGSVVAAPSDPHGLPKEVASTDDESEKILPYLSHDLLVKIMNKTSCRRDAVRLAAASKEWAAAYRASIWPRPGYKTHVVAPGVPQDMVPGAGGQFHVIVEAGVDLQAAINRVPEGGSILLRAGEYQGPIVLDREVHIFSEAGARLIMPHESSGQSNPLALVVMHAKGSTIDGLQIGRGNTTYKMNAVHIFAGGCRLQECDILNNYNGINIMTRADLSPTSLVDCTIHGSRGTGVSAVNRAVVHIDRCTFFDNRTSVNAVFESEFHMRDCDIHHSIIGLALGAGLHTIEDCTIRHNRQEGIYFFNATDARVSRCRIANNFVGVLCPDGGYRSSTGVLHQCDIKENGEDYDIDGHNLFIQP